MTTDVTTTANTENDKSERRKMVVQMVSAGVPRSDIAQQLGVSVSTVHSDMNSYFGAEERGIHQIAREVRRQVIDELIIDRERKKIKCQTLYKEETYAKLMLKYCL